MLQIATINHIIKLFLRAKTQAKFKFALYNIKLL